MESKKDNPLVAIIIINYRGSKDTIECINSINRNNYDNYVVIVVDNDEIIDKGLDAIQDNDKVIRISTGKNLGFSGGNNYGIRYAMKKYSPDFYLLLNNDTIVEKDFLVNIIQTATSNPSHNLYTGKIYYYFNKKLIWYAGGEFNKKTGWTNHYGANLIDDGTYDMNREVTFATGCYWLLPKRTIKEIGMMSEDYFLYSEDTDYCCRIAQAHGSILYCPESVIYHKVSASTSKVSENQQYYYVRNDLMIIKRYCDDYLRIFLKHSIVYLGSILKGTKSINAVIVGYYDFFRRRVGIKDEKSKVK